MSAADNINKGTRIWAMKTEKEQNEMKRKKNENERDGFHFLYFDEKIILYGQ